VALADGNSNALRLTNSTLSITLEGDCRGLRRAWLTGGHVCKLELGKLPYLKIRAH
jgi:hypothetical protein